MSNVNDLQDLAMPNWYQRFGNCAFPTTFVWLRPEAIARLASDVEPNREEFNEVDLQVIEDLRLPISRIPGAVFPSVDNCSPTDTERFAAKRGAVHSPESVWFFLRQSIKVRGAAQRGQVSCICLRSFRHMTVFREFRLFIKERNLFAMSQYSLLRHYHRLEREKEHYLELAEKFVEENRWRFPRENLAADIYFTANDEILLLDLNPWGEPTDPLLLRKWDRLPENKLLTMAPPAPLHGDVNVSF